MTPAVLTVAEASAYLRVSEDVVYRLVSTGELRAWRAAASLAAGRYELAAAAIERAARRGA